MREQTQLRPIGGIAPIATTDHGFKFWPGFLILLALFSQAGCSARNSTPASQSPETSATPDPTDPAPETESPELYPAGMSQTERSLVDEWGRQIELCQGSEDVATTDRACRAQNRAERKLKAAGWCWAYEDWRVARSDYRWHACSEKTLPGADLAPDLPDAGTSPGQKPEVGSQEQRREDARAAIRQGWLVSGALIQRISFAASCGLVERVLAGIAIHRIELSMQDQLIPAGLLGDPTMYVGPFTRRFKDAGLTEARAGKCAQLTPVERGNVRSTITALAN